MILAQNCWMMHFFQKGGIGVICAKGPGLSCVSDLWRELKSIWSSFEFNFVLNTCSCKLPLNRVAYFSFELNFVLMCSWSPRPCLRKLTFDVLMWRNRLVENRPLMFYFNNQWHNLPQCILFKGTTYPAPGASCATRPLFFQKAIFLK